MGVAAPEQAGSPGTLPDSAFPKPFRTSQSPHTELPAASENRAVQSRWLRLPPTGFGSHQCKQIPVIFLFIPTEVCHQISVGLANTFALQSQMHHWLARLLPLRETHFSPCGQSPQSLFHSQQQREQ